ncbi:MAG: WecB/TagA/CpsF family glycosyltransferase [Candidatus Falkowbacteria bacterium]|nr:WecB/TagA/CpsF family glycosyltransferase [Candidatus Falkowbacteria bacterium]
MNILGINISELNWPELIRKIKEFLNDGRQHYIVTPNPEIILASHHDEEFFYILNQADLAPADGFGLKIAARLGAKNLPRISGADLSPEILKLAEENKQRVAIINWVQGLSNKQELTSALAKKYPNLKFLIIATEKKSHLSDSELNELNNFQPLILFTALGAPDQEKIIWHNLKKIPSLRLALGVGGTFDFLTKKAKRAPKILRTLGLEWLWRLLKQPKRIKRIIRATVVFGAKVIAWRFIHPLRYRPNVA